MTENPAQIEPTSTPGVWTSPLLTLEEVAGILRKSKRNLENILSRREYPYEFQVRPRLFNKVRLLRSLEDNKYWQKTRPIHTHCEKVYSKQSQSGSPSMEKEAKPC